MLRSSNPALSDNTFDSPLDVATVSFDKTQNSSDVMTLQGTINKSFILIGLVMVSAFSSWQSTYAGSWVPDAQPQISPWYLVAFIGAMILSFVIIFKKTYAPYLAPLYAVLEGLTLGVISSAVEIRYPGIALQAVFCTFGTFVALLMAYKSGLIKVTENFTLGITAATFGIAIVYLIDLGLRLFGRNVPYIHENGMMGIGISLLITAIAALNLVMDFDFIERGAEARAPKYMEWYSAFGLLVTLVWLYIEILRLLMKARDRK